MLEYHCEILEWCSTLLSLLFYSGGYYLTSAYGAMSLIRNFQEEQAARVLSSETRNTLHQWHRRRTTQRTAPSVDDFQVTQLCICFFDDVSLGWCKVLAIAQWGQPSLWEIQ